MLDFMVWTPGVIEIGRRSQSRRMEMGRGTVYGERGLK
jgi:hypothetical protein